MAGVVGQGGAPAPQQRGGAEGRVIRPGSPGQFRGIDTQDDDLVSVMMPFGAEFAPVYAALQEAATRIGLKCQRADDIWMNYDVIQDIVDLIAKARS